MRLVADIGFIGFPNSGKSTLLASLTNAFPKIAAYPFTTLWPQLGVIQYLEGKYVTLADLPGLIEGSCDDKGIGYAFLKHVQNTNILLYLFDISDMNPQDPVE